MRSTRGTSYLNHFKMPELCPKWPSVGTSALKRIWLDLHMLMTLFPIGKRAVIMAWSRNENMQKYLHWILTINHLKEASTWVAMYMIL